MLITVLIHVGLCFEYKSVFIPVNNVDGQRAFSGYSDILTNKRTRLLPQNVETALSLYFGDGCNLE